MPRIASTDRQDAFQRAVAQIAKAIDAGKVRDWHYLRRLAEAAAEIHGCKGRGGDVLKAAKHLNPGVGLRVAQ